MSNNIGRPKTYNFDLEQKEHILSLIKDYNLNHNPYPRIRYKHVWEYSLKLYHQNQFPFKTSYDFWKRKGRLGRELVDTVNSLEQKKVYLSKSERIDLINLKELIDKYGGNNKDILWDNVEPYDRHINSFIKKINKLEEDNIQLKNNVVQKDEKIQHLNETNKKLQSLLFSLFTYSNKENELVNMINTGQSSSKVINQALENTFENPAAFVLELTKHTGKNISNVSSISNVIPVNKKKIDNYEDKPEYDL